MNEVYAVVQPKDYTSEDYEAEWGAGWEQKTPNVSVELHVVTTKPIGSLSPTEAKAVRQEIEYMLFQLSDLYESFR